MKIICIARSHVAHADELKNRELEDPVVFLKPDTSILLKNQPFFIPDFSNEVHYEIELIVKINKVGKHISPKFAHKYYDEISVGIDFTAHDLQKDLISKGLSWECSKGFDGATVLGKWMPKTDFGDINDLSFQLMKNDEVVQTGLTKLMLYSVDELIAYVSQFFTLKIGDVIFTGTPPVGVGPVAINDQLKGSLEGKELFHIKVK